MVLLHTCKHISSLHSKLLSTLSIMYYHAIELIMRLRIMIYAAVRPRSAARVFDTATPHFHTRNSLRTINAFTQDRIVFSKRIVLSTTLGPDDSGSRLEAWDNLS